MPKLDAVTALRAWERNRHYGDLQKAVAFLPSLLADSSLRSNDTAQSVHGVLLFADISGFTALTEKFVQRSGVDRGTDELAQTLNEYLCDILEEFLIFGGDILKHINKVLLCDKGCTFLCVLGLPGNKLPCESLHALQSALEIFNSCSTMLKETETMSVAVTRGTVFCGVTGHPLRHEYTVLGRKVNLAARMMVHYPGLVSCDAVTYAASRLPASYFKELPQREMKGLRQPGPVYQFVGVT
ncbi:adenylate cyclase type 10-like, partial [Rissa tridactyla]|uniref:adenylate cyclase type 10-like n=1 Tax=Rissa tridactyla TaxID=75485 RepID=UPI0023BB0A66